MDVGHHLVEIVKRIGKVGNDLVDGKFDTGMMGNKIRKGCEIVKKHVVKTVYDLRVILALQLVFIVESCDHGQEITRIGVSDFDPGVVREGDALKFIVNILEAVVGVVGMNAAGRKEENISRFKANKSPVDYHRPGTLGIAYHLPEGVGMKMEGLDRRMDTAREFYLSHDDSLMDKYGTWPMYSKFFDYEDPLFHHLHLDFDAAARVGKLGNLVQLAEAMKCFHIVTGISPVWGDTVKIMPRFPKGGSVSVKDFPLVNTNATMDMETAYPTVNTQSMSLTVKGDCRAESIRIRFGPVASDCETAFVTLNDQSCHLSTERCGDARWAWLQIGSSTLL